MIMKNNLNSKQIYTVKSLIFLYLYQHRILLNYLVIANLIGKNWPHYFLNL